jgi:hypothetical protein
MRSRRDAKVGPTNERVGALLDAAPVPEDACAAYPEYRRHFLMDS